MVEIDNDYELTEDAQAYSAILEGRTQYPTLGGVVIVEDLVLTGTPNQEYSVSFSSDGIKTDLPANQEIMISTNSTNIDIDIELGLRGCQVGEYFTTAGKCLACEGIGFTLKAQEEPGQCEPCPEEYAKCYHGVYVGPKRGYWRRDNQTSNFLQCLNPDACLPIDPSNNYSAVGECASGYYGVLCSNCEPGYSRTGDYACSPCPDPFWNVIRIIATLLFAIILIVLMIKSTMAGAVEKKNVTSIFMKILMNHMQLITLTASFNFSWPEQVLSFFSAVKPASSASTQVLSFDCFLSGSKNTTAEEGDGMKVFW